MSPPEGAGWRWRCCTPGVRLSSASAAAAGWPGCLTSSGPPVWGSRRTRRRFRMKHIQSESVLKYWRDQICIAEVDVVQWRRLWWEHVNKQWIVLNVYTVKVSTSYKHKGAHSCWSWSVNIVFIRKQNNHAFIFHIRIRFFGLISQSNKEARLLTSCYDGLNWW